MMALYDLVSKWFEIIGFGLDIRISFRVDEVTQDDEHFLVWCDAIELDASYIVKQLPDVCLSCTIWNDA